MLQRDSYVCAYCGKDLVGDDATVDHINPVARNEDHNYSDDELVSACRSCNSSKQDRTVVRTFYVNQKYLSV